MQSFGDYNFSESTKFNLIIITKLPYMVVSCLMGGKVAAFSEWLLL